MAQQDRPSTTSRAQGDRADRERREAAALRENLRRRKEQAHNRPQAGPPADQQPSASGSAVAPPEDSG